MAAPASQEHAEPMEKIHVLFPTTVKSMLSMKNVEKLRRDVGRDWMFIASGLGSIDGTSERARICQ